MVRILLSPGAMNLQELIVIPKLFCWKIYIDVEVFSDSGNVFDLIILSVMIALRTTRIPITTPIKNADQEEKDFAIDDDPTHFRRLSCMSIPIGISLLRVGNTMIVDATQEEEDCVDAWILVCVNRKKEIVSINSLYGKVDSQVLLGALQVASMCSEFLFRLVDSVIDVWLVFALSLVER